MFLGQIINTNSVKVLPEAIKHFVKGSPRTRCWEGGLGPGPRSAVSILGTPVKSSAISSHCWQDASLNDLISKIIPVLKFLGPFTHYPKTIKVILNETCIKVGVFHEEVCFVCGFLKLVSGIKGSVIHGGIPNKYPLVNTASFGAYGQAQSSRHLRHQRAPCCPATLSPDSLEFKK